VYIENVCVEEARRESIKEKEKKAVDMSQDVCIRSLSQKQEVSVRNRKQEAERASQTRSAKRTSFFDKCL
jgi:hypothetical protein